MKCITNFDVSNIHHELGNEIKLYYFLVRKGYCMFALLLKNKCNTHHQPDFFRNSINGFFAMSIAYLTYFQ